jgi:hypothetical protein
MCERRGRRAVGVLAVIALIGLVAGCADIPTSGAVHVGRPLSAVGGLGDVDVHFQPPQAQPGMSATDVVRGFLRAVVNNDGGYEIARTYLTKRAGAAWDATGTTTYDDGSVQLTTLSRSGRRQVDLQVQRRGSIDARGEFTPEAGRLHVTYRLVRQGGEWRIDQLPRGVLLSTSDAQRALRLGTLYFVDPTRSWLVPERVLLRPESRGLSTALARALIDGPGPWLDPAVRTGFPQGSALLGNVAVDQDGVAEVNLSAAVRQATPEQLREIAAQLVWTLTDESQVTAVRLLADSAPLAVPNSPSVQTRGSWSDFDPAPAVGLPAFYLRGDGWRSAAGGTNPSLQSAVGLSDLAITADGHVLAAIGRHRGGASLLTWHSGGQPETRLQAAALTPPTTNRAGDVFTVETVHRRHRLIDVTPAGEIRSVASGGLDLSAVQGLAVSYDGARIAALVGRVGHARLLVGRVGTGRAGFALGGFRDVLPSWTDVRGVAWDGAGQLVTTALDDTRHRRLVAVDLDGYSWRVLSTDGVAGAPVDVAAAPGQPLVVLASGAIWQARALGGWRRVAAGQQPSYPG